MVLPQIFSVCLSFCLAHCSQVRLLRLRGCKHLCVVGRAAQLIPSAVGSNEVIKEFL